LRTIKGRAYHDAKEYICNAPQQIKTSHRAVLEKELKLKSVVRGPELTKRSRLRQDLEKRTFYKSTDGSFWALVPDRPAAFGHVVMVSWRGRGDQDAADCGIFTDPMHMGEIMKIAHNLVWEMKNRLTSNGRPNGKKCQKVYILVQCETKSFPFHIHLIPRFERCNKANLYLLETELEEARWMMPNGDQIARVKDGIERVRNARLILKRYNKLIKSNKWAKEDDERSCFVNAIMKWFQCS
jgi:diadenosine tetraphosphate (Ap4A) HIT family hydrolase